MTDLATLLARAADDLVPEHQPFTDRVGGVSRRIRRRRTVRSVQTGAAAMVGVVAIGSSALLLAPGPGPDPAGPPAVCGESAADVLPAAGDLDGVATIQASDGMSVSTRTQLENLGDVDATTTGTVRYLVSLQGTGQVVGYSEIVPDAQTTVPAGTSGEVVTTATLVSCGFAGTGAGDPLPDGIYDLTLTGTAQAPDGSEIGWTSATNGITVEDGQVRATTGAPDPTTDPTPDAAFEPSCGAMIPAVAENPMWATLDAPAASFMPADPDAPYQGGMSLDVTVGTVSTEPIVGELSPEIVVVLTDHDGTVVTWWRASDHGRPLDLGAAIDLPAEGSQLFEGFGWFPVTDACADDAPIADGGYRLFGWVEVAADTGAGAERYPVLTAPLDVTVADSVLTQD